MSAWRHLVHGLRALVRRSEAERDAADEIRHFIEEAAADYEARGLTRREALRQVRLDFGGEMQARARLGDHGWEHAAEALWLDLRYAVRRLLGEPIFTAVAIVTLAIGLGATTAIFSAVDAILLQPLPYPAAGRLVGVWDVGEASEPLAVTFGTFRELTERSRSFDRLAVLKPWQPTLSGTDVPVRLDGQQVSAGYFDVLGVGPVLGRGFRAADDRVGGPAEVILSDATWRRHFGADPNILGRLIQLDEQGFAVIGVMPPRFENVTSPSAGVWSTLQYGMSQGRAWGHHLRAVGRLLPEVGAEAAGRELAGIAATPLEEFSRPDWAALEHGLTVRPLQDEVTGAVKPALLALLGAAGLLLAIVGVNMAHLMLARGARRRGEFALRTALGAGRERLIRQMMTESLVLAVAGGLAGLGVAHLGVGALARFGPQDLPRLDAIALDGPVFFVGLGLAALVGLAFGLVPALRAAGGDPRRGLGGGFGRSTRRGPSSRGALVVAEVALAVVLLVGAGLLLRSLQGLLDVEVGFEPAGVQTLQVQVSGDRFGNRETEAFYSRVLDAVRACPGVSAAAFTSQLPLSGDYDVYGILVGDAARHAGNADAERERFPVFRYAVSPGYLDAMGIPLLQGRALERRDEVGQRVAMISESVATKHLAGSDPMGQPLHVGPADRPPYTIVGVVADVRQVSLDLEDADAVYVPSVQWHFADGARSLVVRAGDLGNHAKGGGLVADLRTAIWSVDETRPIVRVAAMQDLVDASVAERRFTWTLLQAFALASLILAATGIYGVVAGSVSERRRELGVRAALGASGRTNTAMVLRQGLRLTALGAVFGVAAALVATRALSAMLFEVSPLDPITYLAVVGLLGVVAGVAGSLPALRAGRIDPATVLRAE